MKCACGKFEVVRRGRTQRGRGYRAHIEQLGNGQSVDHSREGCLKFTRTEAQNTGQRWCYGNIRPQTMERVA